jgi:cytochrome P450
MGPDLPPLTYDSLQQLTLHQNVLRETLRLHAPIHSIMRKVRCPLAVPGTPYTIPASHTVLAAPGVSSRNPEHFPNPETWEPHRWDGEGVKVLGSDEKEDFGYGLVTKGTKSPYLPFGAGRHRCIGEQFAYVQVIAILATFVRQFKLRNLPGRGLVATDYSVSGSFPPQWTLVRGAVN